MNADEVTLAEAAALLGSTRRALGDRARRGRVRARLVPGAHGRPMLVIPRAEVERWTQARHVGNRLVPPAPQT
jgi:hypothetical protein